MAGTDDDIGRAVDSYAASLACRGPRPTALTERELERSDRDSASAALAASITNRLATVASRVLLMPLMVLDRVIKETVKYSRRIV